MESIKYRPFQTSEHPIFEIQCMRPEYSAELVSRAAASRPGLDHLHGSETMRLAGIKLMGKDCFTLADCLMLAGREISRQFYLLISLPACIKRFNRLEKLLSGDIAPVRLVVYLL